MSIWPTFSKLPDQSTWVETREDPSVSTDMEGGFQMSRPRFTRAPRKTFRFSFMDLTNDDNDAFWAFWAEVLGPSNAFTFAHPFNGQTYQVRFSTKTAGIAPESHYANFHRKLDGSAGHRWNIQNIELAEV